VFQPKNYLACWEKEESDNMKIPGSFFEVLLKLKDELIEFQVLKQGSIEYRAHIIDFSEIEADLADILEENDIFLPQNRLDRILRDLEAEYLEVQQKQRELQKQHLQKQKSFTQSYQALRSPNEVVKILLTGFSGKSSIYQIIFEGKLANEIQTTLPTRRIEKHILDFSFLAKQNRGQKLEIWESGSFFPDDSFFQDATVLLFVIDSFDVDHYEEMRLDLHKSVKKMNEMGTNPQYLPKNRKTLFCLIHKMDRFQKILEKFRSLVNYFQIDPSTGKPNREIVFYPTSIFDSSLYKAWTQIIETLMPKSSKLDQLSNQLKEDLALYTVLIIEKRTGLPICSSKTLLDDATLVGTTNRIIITIEKILPDYKFTNLRELRIDTATGFVKVHIFNEYYILLMICPPNVNLDAPAAKRIIRNFIANMKNYI